VLWTSEEFAAGTYVDKSLYDTLFFKASITNNSAGNYGIKIQLTTVSGTEELDFNSKEFIGNPNAFRLESEQEKAFQINQFDEIK